MRRSASVISRVQASNLVGEATVRSVPVTLVSVNPFTEPSGRQSFIINLSRIVEPSEFAANSPQRQLF